MSHSNAYLAWQRGRAHLYYIMLRRGAAEASGAPPAFKLSGYYTDEELEEIVTTPIERFCFRFEINADNWITIREVNSGEVVEFRPASDTEMSRYSHIL